MAGALGIEDCFASRFKLKIRRALFLFGALLSMHSSCVAFVAHDLVHSHDLVVGFWYTCALRSRVCWLYIRNAPCHPSGEEFSYIVNCHLLA